MDILEKLDRLADSATLGDKWSLHNDQKGITAGGRISILRTYVADDARFINAANPETIKALVAVARAAKIFEQNIRAQCSFGYEGQQELNKALEPFTKKGALDE